MQHPMLTLWAAADPAKLTNEVLESMNKDTEVCNQLDYLSSVAEGIGCLVMADEDAGNFQSNESVPDLLFSISSALRHISAMSWVSTEAQAVIRERAKHAAAQTEVKS